jgi:hypothetical protein
MSTPATFECNATLRLKGGRPEETAVASQGLGKHVTAATNTHERVEKLSASVFYMRSVSCQRKAGDYFFPEQNWTRLVEAATAGGGRLLGRVVPCVG